MSKELPSSYTTLFGPIDIAEGNEARSVLSPSAYLVDLLQLKDSISRDLTQDFHARRPDVQNIRLDQANTFGEIPFLTVANQVMGTGLSAATLTDNLYPPPLPFSEQHLRMQLYAEKLGTSLDELQRLYRTTANAHLSARLRLGFSVEEYAMYSTAHDTDAELKKLWGVMDLSTIRGSDVALIKDKLGISLKELKQIVRQDLALSETQAPENFYVNQGANYIVLDESPPPVMMPPLPSPTLKLKDGSPLANVHLDRLMRFVRLARRLGLSFIELDPLLQTACGNRIDEDGLQALAIALEIRKQSEDMPIDELCSLWSTPKAYGFGDGVQRADLFDRVFNNDFRLTLQAHVASATSVDALDERLQATLRISGADFAFLTSALVVRGFARPALNYAAVVAYFSALRRIVSLSTLLGLSVQEVVLLLDVLGAQWTVSGHEDLNIPLPFNTAANLAPLSLLMQPDAPPRKTMDALQKILRVKAWLDQRQISARQLAFICLEDHYAARQRLADGSPIDEVLADDAVEAALADLRQALSDSMLTSSTLQTGSLTAQGAQAVFDALRQMRVLATFGDPGRALLRVLPTAGELRQAMEAGVRERLQVHAGDLAALGFTDLDPLFSLLVSHGYLDRFSVTVDGELEVRSFIAPGVDAFFADANNAAKYTIPNFQAQAEAIFSALALRVNAASFDGSAFAATGVDTSDVAALFAVLQAHGYVEAVPASSPTTYRVTTEAKPFFQDATNVDKFALPNFAASFVVLSAKAVAYQRAQANLTSEANELAQRLSTISEQQQRIWMRSLSGLIGLAEDVSELVFAWAFGTPDETQTQTLAGLALPLFATAAQSRPALSDAFVASRFRRMQQLALLVRKTAMSADEAGVYLNNQQVHRRLPETLKVPAIDAPAAPFLTGGVIDALTTLPSGDFLIISGQRYATFAQSDYRLLGTGTLDAIPGVTLTDPFRTRVLTSGFDAVFSDRAADGSPLLHLCAGDLYVTVTATTTSAAKPITDWGQVRNTLQGTARVDAALTAEDGKLYLFAGDQYYRYSNPSALLTGPEFVDEGYPLAIRTSFASEGISPLPAAMYSKVDAAFRDTDDTYYFFSGHSFSHSTDRYNLQKIRPVFGLVLNHLFQEKRVDAAFVLGSTTYLTRQNQLTRYSGTSYQFVDEGFPITFGNIAESDALLRVLKRFPSGLDAALAGSDGALYAFKSGVYASSAAPDTMLPIRDRWGRVRNLFIDNDRIDGAFSYNGTTYLFCADQYVRYSGAEYTHVDEGYPRAARTNWNTLEGLGNIPAGLPLPITAVAVGRAPGGTSDDLYFFGGTQFAGPSGALASIKSAWARVRNTIQQSGVVDAALVDASGAMFLFSGDQYVRYTSPSQTFVDESYPRTIAGSWPQEGAGYSLPASFGSGISAALRSDDGKIYFFSGTSYARVDVSPSATPSSNATDWALVRNNIQSQNQVDAAFVDSTGKTFLFRGDQFFRYSTTPYDFVDEGYPLAITTRWGNLPTGMRSGIDNALFFKSPVDGKQRLYLFKDSSYVRYSGAFTSVDPGYPRSLSDGVMEEGTWFKGFSVHDPMGGASSSITGVDASYVEDASGVTKLFIFYRLPSGEQWRREFSGGSWKSPAKVSMLTEYSPFTRVDAAFVAPDGRLHVFMGTQYASRAAGGTTLSTPVAIRSVWGRVFNQFADLGRVDACLNMGGGSTYLFCAKQFIKYSSTLRPGATDFYVDEGYPRLISTSWAAEGISVTLPNELQAAGYDLCRDNTGKVHVWSNTRYAFSGGGADVLLTTRWGNVENRFQDLDRVDGAYRAENGKLYLFCDTQYVRYSGAVQPGSTTFFVDEGYPRKIATNWAAESLLPSMPSPWNALGSALFYDGQATYVFSGTTYTSSQNATAAPILPKWANVRNQIQAQNQVDAGFTYKQGMTTFTFLFCNDQYVRYSGGYTGFVDEGYPKAIARLATADGLFAGLPTALQSGLRAAFAGTDGNLHAFSVQPADAQVAQQYVSSANPSFLQPLHEKWGIVDNKLWDNEFVNAALLTAGGALFLFSGDQYVRYSTSNRQYVDEGYPHKIASTFATEIGAAALAPILNTGIDAALRIGTTTFYFAQDQYVRSDHADTAQPIVNQWGLVKNLLQTLKKLDAGFVAPNGTLYLFAGTQYSQYSGADRQYVDAGFPRTLAANLGVSWPHATTDFRTDLGAIAAFEGRSYLFKGTQHVRISDFRLLQPDAGYPLANDSKFVDRYDFELGALPDYFQIKQLFDDFSGQLTTLLDYLDDTTMDRVSGLARATTWPVDEITTLLGLLSLPASSLLDGRTVERLARYFEMGERIGATPTKIKSQFWDLAFGSGALNFQLAADYLYGLIKVATSPRDWPAVSRAIDDPRQAALRDALSAYLVHSQALRNADELYQRLLIDVQMGASADTTRIVEAINAVQLYYHRALVHLETLDADPTKEKELTGHLQTWWPWMKNYRIWEANRKVFLHPENYIRPELRPEKSPAFEELEEKLMQDEITAISVQEGYQRYLEALNEISRLRIVGGYRYSYPAGLTERTAVFMIGVSRADPPVYYYRVGDLSGTGTDEIDWAPWQKLGITINSARVQPVYAFNRLFIFWIETKPYNQTSFDTGDGTYSSENSSVNLVKLQVKYSFYNFNKEWVAPQTVRINPDNPADPESMPFAFPYGYLSARAASLVTLVAYNPQPVNSTDDDFIYLAFRYSIDEWKIGRLTAGLDLEVAPYPRWFWTKGAFPIDPRSLFPTHLGISLSEVSAVVPWGAHTQKDTGTWLSFDAKGGTFLCRPVNVVTTAPGKIFDHAFASVSAAFITPKEKDVFVFTSETHGAAPALCFYRYRRTGSSGTWIGPTFVDDPAWPWGRPLGVFQDDPAKRIRNVVVSTVDQTTYFLLDTKYFSYPTGNYQAIREKFIADLQTGAPPLSALVDPAAVTMDWDTSTSSTTPRTLVGAFKHPGAMDTAVLVTDGMGGLGVLVADLADLRAATKTMGSSPFDALSSLDTVFVIGSPPTAIGFSSGDKLLVYDWHASIPMPPPGSFRSVVTLALPGSATKLSAAFTGLDKKLYYFAGDTYAEVQLPLEGSQNYVEVKNRWGKPCLFPTLLKTVDGAAYGPDGKLYLFSEGYTHSYSNFDPTKLDALVIDRPAEDPQRVSDVWKSDFNEAPSIQSVTAAFERYGVVWLFGVRNDNRAFTAHYSSGTAAPFSPDPGYPIQLFEKISDLPTDLYALLLAPEVKYAITRLTSHTAEQFGRRLFAGGIPKLLSLETQKLPELPRFTKLSTVTPAGRPPAPDELFVNAPTVVDKYPGDNGSVGLDFASANGFYYREIFFHIPYLIAQALKQEQRFADAKLWYEYVFDPTTDDKDLAMNRIYWRYIEFVNDRQLKELDDQVRAYKDDPFDPHRIAELRPIAYRKAFAMSYIDNLLTWGDLLFRQYTRESIGEATMLYVLAADLLGKKPEELGKRAMSKADSLTYKQITDPSDPTIVPKINDEILELENGVPPVSRYLEAELKGIPHDSIFNPYFYIPENEQFSAVWDRVGDRLFKIRNGLNIDGVKQALALFSPPIDVNALVAAFASGAGLSAALADFNAPVPHYRFMFMLSRARELTTRLTGLGGSLLAALEKKDAEELSLLRNTQERSILELQLKIKKQQSDVAKESLAALQEGLKNAQARESHYSQLISTGLTAHEQTQIGAMIAGQVFSTVSNVLSIVASIAAFGPNIGSPFAMTYGGKEISSGITGLVSSFRALAETANFQSSLAGTLGAWERRGQEWQLQKTLATGDTQQIGHQINAAQIQVAVAEQEIQVQERLIKNNESIDTFMNSKFTSRQLYQYMIGKLSTVYFQTYNLALDYAKAAQRAMQFELGLPESDVQHIGAAYWDSLKKGLTAGERLQLDIDRLEKAYLDANGRRLEITRTISLALVDPLALLQLKERGRCEFELSEALFDADFPGHYARQVKAVSLSFPAVIGPYDNFNATLTQLGHRTVLSPDKGTVSYLLNGPSQLGSQPAAHLLRVDWRPNQQVALSRGVNDSGLFQLNYQDERFLPFEGTGAVSTWRLEVNGVDGPAHRQALTDVILTLQYTARSGGDAFAETVKSLISKKARERAAMLNLAYDFPVEWQAFMNKPSDGLNFFVEKRRLPGITDKSVSGVYLHYDVTENPVDDVSRQAMTVNGITLKPGAFKTGLTLPVVENTQGSGQWKLAGIGAGAKKFTPDNIKNIALVVIYKSKPSF